MAGGSLQNRRIIVTGAASGIGRATAELFEAEGARVGWLDLDVVALDRAMTASPGLRLAADVTEKASVEAAVAKTVQEFGGVDGVVNAAGIADKTPATELGRERWDRVIAVNLTGPFLLCQAAQPHLSHNETSTIVNIASASALLPSGAGAAYAASKAGVLLLTKSLALEWAPRVRVNAICPGTVDTPMLDGLFDRDAAFAARIQAAYPLRRMARSNEIAHAVLFLTTSQSSYVTGVSLAVDGGRTFH